MFEFEDDAPVEMGNPETWSEFVDRIQRTLGKSARVFVLRQPSLNEPEPGVMVFIPGPYRPDFIPRNFGDCTHPKVEKTTNETPQKWCCIDCGHRWPVEEK